MEFAPDGPMAIPMWVNGHAYLTVVERFFDVVDAKSGAAIRRVPLCGATEAEAAAAAAKAAQPDWAASGLQARRVCLGNLADALDRLEGHFAKLLQQETVADEEGAKAQVQAAVAALRGAAVGDTGVIGVVVDDGKPLSAFAAAIAPAVLAGATVVVKPSPRAPSAVFALCELSSRAEWPAGVLNLLQGDQAALEGLCASGIDRLVYRGRAELGAQVAKVAAAAGVAVEPSEA